MMRPEELDRRSAELKSRMLATRNIAESTSTVKHMPVPGKPSPVKPPPNSGVIRVRQLIAQTRRGASEVKVGDDRLLCLAGSDRLDVTVSRKTLPRALQFLSLMLKAFEAGGLGVAIVRRDSAWSTVAVACGERIQVQVREIVRAVERPRASNGTYWYSRQYDHHPTGRLSLEIVDCTAPRRTWNDGARQRLEGCIDSIVSTLVTTGERLRATRLIREAEEQIRLVERRHELARERAQREEHERIEALNSDVDRWHRSAAIRAYLGAFRACMEKWSGQIDPKSDVGRWLAWAEQYAARLDPLKPDCK